MPETRAALITGATSGIGHATALMLLDRGYHVVAVGRRREHLSKLQQRFGNRVHGLETDLGNPGAAATILQAIPEAWRVDTLIHAAGHDAGGSALYHQGRAEDRSAKVAVNLMSLADLVQGLLPQWVSRDAGDLVAVGSIVAYEQIPGLSEYTMTKHGLHGLMKALRMDYASTRLRFIEIIPGVVRSGFAARRWGGDEARAAEFYERFKQYLLPEDVATAVVWALTQPPHVAIDEIVIRPTLR